MSLTIFDGACQLVADVDRRWRRGLGRRRLHGGCGGTGRVAAVVPFGVGIGAGVVLPADEELPPVVIDCRLVRGGAEVSSEGVTWALQAGVHSASGAYPHAVLLV